ncbi:HCP-like protein [Gloeophyllum trabeum ATCC 11539]|uniref:HCP-like protein n=1 Tax=Gloeophyllum trabeum (strain ATCC 11539 / FP-39264 / Madison 617) TaxID=670483 RepID=S7RCT8_GLOTA|nr:HCP-like protein [Gloeophyllum trabeum ATCC 11539]EPQ52010.1 HCP-like protein [Gloeophyllum trabeum ATCC 11539]
MAAAPPVPPRPSSAADHDTPPPVPPLPPNFRPSSDESPPHFEAPLAAPRPTRADPDVPANMARTLDEQLSPPPFPPAPPPPPPNNAQWSGWNPSVSPPPPALPYPGSPPPPPNQTPSVNSLSSSMAALSFDAPQHPTHPPRATSVYSTYGPPAKPPSPPRAQAGVPSLTAPLPTTASLAAVLPSVQRPDADPAARVSWCKDVLALVDRVHHAGADAPVGPAHIADAQLQRLADLAVPMLLQIAAATQQQQHQQSPMPRHVAEAVYLRATIQATGAYPQYCPHNPRAAFRDFEQAARSGYAAAWFKLGRDYENFNDLQHAKDCFERGVKLGVESCLYRMGMAHLMGQLGLPPKPELALPLLQKAATLASTDVPQPAYVYGLLLLSEFAHVQIPPYLFTPLIPPGSSLHAEARRHLERAAYLNFAPAQYKLGHAYEYAQPPFPYDPLLSVQYYSLASQQGEIEADMALSKWFLCGAEGCFEKDEALAYTFAEKAARRGLPSAEFAMGYYAEVGVGGPKDIDAARKWYTRASQHGNADAAERLAALSQPAPQALSRQEHDALTESQLVRKRTQAKQRSDARPGAQPPLPPPAAGHSQRVVDVIRKNSVAQGPAIPQQQQQQQQQQHPTLATQTGVATPRPQPQRAHPQAQRYTLTDPGADPRRAQSPARQQSPAGRPPAQRIPSGGAPLPEPSAGESPRPRPAKGPATFEEMGFQSKKLDDKDCVIM